MPNGVNAPDGRRLQLGLQPVVPTLPTTRAVVAEKTCGKCGECKPRKAFSRHASARDGLQSWCKDCHRAQYQVHAEKAKKRTRRWVAKNGEARAAHVAVARAIRSGVLLKAPCELCGKKDGVIDAHHHRGYTDPLDVQWLCRSCHVRIEPRRTAS